MTIYSSISSNKWKTYLIMFFFVIFITTIVYVFAQASGYGLSFVGLAFIISGILSIGSYYYSDKIVLATSGAKQIKKSDAPQYFRIVENLSIAAGLPTPRIYIINDPSPNAFATGRDPKHAVVAATTGLLEKLDKVELEGVISHELSHIKNYDIRLAGVVAILVGFVAIIADMFLRSLWFRDNDNNNGKGAGVFLLIGLIFAILTPIIAILIQLSISRKRELLADASGALLTRYPDGLASALEKLAHDPHPLRRANHATAHMFIVSPFKGREAKAFFSSLFNTHPPLEERIKILRSM